MSSAVPENKFQLSCDICQKEFYIDGDNKPIIIHCGHSYCNSCMNKLKKSKSCCPACKVGERFLRTESNYSLIQACDNLQMLKSFLHRHVYSIRRSIAHQETIIKESEVNDDIKTVLKILKELRTELGNAERTYNPTIISKLVGYETDNRNEYYKKIVLELQMEKKVYYYVKVNNDVRYGEVTLESPFLLFHASSWAEEPKREGLLVEMAKTFEEFVRSSFLKIRADKNGVVRKVNMGFIKSNEMVVKLLYRCIGVSGYNTFKGLLFKQGKSNENFMEVMILYPSFEDVENGVSKYSEEKKKDKMDLLNAYRGETIVVGHSDGDFKILNMRRHMQKPNIIGNVLNKAVFSRIYSKNNLDESRIVVDCGLAITF